MVISLQAVRAHITMRRSFIAIFVCYLFLSCSGAASPDLDEDTTALETKLKMLNKPHVKSFKDKHGVVFDCVDMYKQPAFDHPRLKNHKLQKPPSSSIAGEPTRFGLKESCPDGTVLVRRTLKKDLLRASASVQRFRANRSNRKSRQDKDHSEVAGQHQARLAVSSRRRGSGGESTPPCKANVRQLKYCLSTTALATSASYKLGGVDPDRNGDSQTRFMTYWTADDYDQTGCLNMLCSGFVMLSQTVTPGVIIPTGTIGLNMSRDGQTGNWMVDLGQDIVGYFPKEIFDGLNGATQVQMGGMSYAPPGESGPPMGNGVAPPGNGSYTAATFTQLGAVGAEYDRWWLTKDVSDPAIYNVMKTSSTGPQGDSFQYGGPGGPYD
ncbi:hypothetical protein ACP4OV_005482 [Aristida adscensionis]